MQWFCSPALFFNRPRRWAKSITAAAASPLGCGAAGGDVLRSESSQSQTFLWRPVFSAAHQHSHLSQQRGTIVKRKKRLSITTRVLVSMLRLLQKTSQQRSKYWGWLISIFQICFKTRRRLRLALCQEQVCEFLCALSEKQTGGNYFCKKLETASLPHHYVIDRREWKKTELLCVTQLKMPNAINFKCRETENRMFYGQSEFYSVLFPHSLSSV